MFRKIINIGLSKTAKNLYWIWSGNFIYIVLTFFTTIIIARFLSPTDFGIYLALITFGSLLPDLADIGIGSSLCRFIPELEIDNKLARIKSLKNTAWLMEFFLGGAMFLLTLLFSPILAKHLFADISLTVLFITAGMIWVTQMMTFSIYVLSAHKKFRESTLVNLSYAMVRLLLICIFVIMKRVNLVNILWIYLISVLFSWLYSFLHIGWDWLQLKIDKAEMKKLMGFSGYLGLQKIFVAASSRLDVLMLVPLASAYEAGVYGAASRIAMIYPFAVGGLSQVLAPKMAEFRSNQMVISFLRKVSLIVGVLLVSIAGFLFFADWLIPILFGQKYLEAIPVFKGLLISMIPFVLSVPFVSLVIYTMKKPIYIAIATFIQLVVIGMCNLWFIPKLGRFGPAMGIGLGNLVILAITVWVAINYFNKTKNENRY